MLPPALSPPSRLSLGICSMSARESALTFCEQVVQQAELAWRAKPELSQLLPRASFHGADFFAAGKPIHSGRPAAAGCDQQCVHTADAGSEQHWGCPPALTAASEASVLLCWSELTDWQSG